MDLLSLILPIYLSYRNGMKARLKGLSAIAWAVITFIAIFVAEMIGACIVIFYFCRNVVDINKFVDPAYKDTAVQLVSQAFINNPLHPFTILLCGLGGYLLVRYILEKKPEKEIKESNEGDRPADY